MFKREKSDLSAAMEAVDRDMGVKGRSLREFDTDRLRANLEIERDEMQASLAILNADIDRNVAIRDNRVQALTVVETALYELGEGKAVETIKAVAADIVSVKPKNFTPTAKDKSHTSVEFAEPQPA